MPLLSDGPLPTRYRSSEVKARIYGWLGSFFFFVFRSASERDKHSGLGFDNLFISYRRAIRYDLSTFISFGLEFNPFMDHV